MNMKKTIILISSICLVIACNKQVDSNQSNDKTTINEEKKEVQTQKSHTLKEAIVKNKEELLANKVSIGKGTKRSLFINGEKLIVHGTTLKKGTKVYSASIRQTGVVKGGVVVVTQQLTANQISAKYKINSVTEIADNTFKLVPEASEELYHFYRMLNDSEFIKQVELEVEYSGDRPKVEIQ